MTHMNFFKQHSPNDVEYIRVTLETGFVEHEPFINNRCYAEACIEYTHPIQRLPKFIEAIQRDGFRFFVPEPKLML